MDAVVRAKGQFTIPAAVRSELRLDAGDVVDITVRGDYAILRPQNGESEPGDEPDEWSRRIAQSIEELDAGLGRVFESEDEFLASLTE